MTRDEAVVHLNLEGESQEDIPDFHFLNLVGKNPDASIEASNFGDDYYPVELNYGESLINSLYKESNHALLFIHSRTFFQKGYINTNWILLDMSYHIDVFYNPSQLKKIHRLENRMNIHCNAGVVNVAHKKTLPGNGLV